MAYEAKPHSGERPRAARTDTKDRILAAAAAIAHEVGLAHLSLEAVAARAGVSKGGLLYHFPTKQALLVAAIESQIALAEKTIEDARQQPGTTGVVQALVVAFREMARCAPQPAAGMIAALAENPALLGPVRAHNRRIVEQLKSSESRDRALIAFYALEGMWALDMFQTDPLESDERERVLKAIAELAEPRTRR